MTRRSLGDTAYCPRIQIKANLPTIGTIGATHVHGTYRRALGQTKHPKKRVNSNGFYRKRGREVEKSLTNRKVHHD